MQLQLTERMLQKAATDKLLTSIDHQLLYKQVS